MWIFEFERDDMTFGRVFDSLFDLAEYANNIVCYKRRIILIRPDEEDLSLRYQVINITA